MFCGFLNWNVMSSSGNTNILITVRCYNMFMHAYNKVLILSAVGGSERFLRQELETVLNQTHKNWELLFSNDNADQETTAVMEEYCKKDSRIRMMYNGSGRKGAHGNYRNLIMNADIGDDSYAYYTYMDSDDLWKPDKLEVYVRKAEEVRREKGENTPICFTCNMELIDSDGTVTDPDFASTYAYEIRHPMDAFLTHRVFGCNVFFDRQVFHALRKMMSDPLFPKTISFDNFTYQTAAALGADCSFIPKVLMSYRRHQNNSTKGAVYTITPAYFLKSLSVVSSVIHNNAYIARDSIDSIDYILKLDLSEDKRRELLEVRSGLEKGGIPAMKMWHKYHINCGNTLRTVENWLSLCLGFERKYMDREKYPEL